jgi:hypothetical protein
LFCELQRELFASLNDKSEEGFSFVCKMRVERASRDIGDAGDVLGPRRVVSQLDEESPRGG